jgi:sugar phosphate isomerase/epimerase
MPMVLPGIALCWPSLLDASLIELIEIAGGSGFSALTVAPHLYFQARDAGVTDRELRQRVADAGIKISSIDPLCAGLPGLDRIEQQPREFRKFFIYHEDDCYVTAEALEAKELNIAHFLGRPVEFSVFSAAINGICERAHKRGILATLEFMPNTALPNLTAASALRQAVGTEKASLVVDFWHIARSGATAEDIKQLPKNSIRSVQFSDWTPPTSAQAYRPMTGRDLPGDGKLPLDMLLKAALGNSPSLRLELEIINNHKLKGLPPAEAALELMNVTRRWAENQP